MIGMRPVGHEMYLQSRGSSRADPSGPIWLLKETQPNLRTFRDGNSQLTKFFEKAQARRQSSTNTARQRPRTCNLQT